MIINIQDDILKLHAAGLLDRLLADKTTGRNIMWATDAYAEHGPDYGRDEPITPALITGERSDIIKTRARKAMEQQSERTRRRGEVFTPLWVCGKMIDYADEMWFCRAAGFHKTDRQGRISFTQKRPWQKYVQTTRLEITCGEAPFLVQRYDVETGEAIPVEERGGILDRKLRAVSENAADEADWLAWAQKAVQATYGYEFQGDNLLIARVNVWMSVEEHFQHWRKAQGKRPRKLTKPEGRQLCEIVAWNLWQMDGLTGAIPYRKPEATEQFDFLYLLDGLSEPKDKSQPLCRLYDWERDTNVEYASLKKEIRYMKFDFIIGNPPYQEEVENTSDKPIYNYFMDEAYAVGDKVELITPARFLFNAGKTPKAWNAKMLNDPHYKVLVYNADAKAFFPNTEITGGIAISYHDASETYGPIEVFSSYPLLNEIRYKVFNHQSFSSLFDTMISSFAFHFTPELHKDHPEVAEIMSAGHANDVTTNVFEKLAHLFLEDEPINGEEYLKMYGRLGSDRTQRYVKRSYINSVANIDAYKLYLSKADGAAGTIGKPIPARIIGRAFIAEPNSGATASFFSIGAYASYQEAENAKKYIETKFARTMLSVLKITQDATPTKWKYVPLQDFTPASDIDWSQSIPDIDRQLYAKYGLDEAEIEFIETHVKAME